MSIEDQNLVDQMFADYGMNVDSTLPIPPPGEEAFDLSHEGGEHEVFADLAEQVMKVSRWYANTLLGSSFVSFETQPLH